MREIAARLPSRWVDAGGYRIHYRAGAPPAGSPHPPVVLLHGLVVSGRYMLPTAASLADEFEVGVPDLPGFGLSADPERTLNVTELSAALAAWAAAIGMERFSLLANSFGCQIASEFALDHPGHLHRLVLVGPTLDPRVRSPLTHVARLALDLTREPISLLPVLLRDAVDAGVRRGVRTFRFALRHELRARLPGIMTPALVVRGARDPIVPQPWAEEVARLLPRGTLQVIPGAAHVVNFSAPEALADVAVPFLRGEPVRETPPA